MDLPSRAREALVKSSPKTSKYVVQGRYNHTPFSGEEYRRRLFSFQKSPHFPLSRPFSCSSVAAALNGFFLFDADAGGIECVTCHARTYQPWSADALESVYSRYSQVHLISCPWIVLPCLESIQFFENVDLKFLFNRLHQAWSQYINDASVIVYLCKAGWMPLSDKVGSCLYGCGRCVVSEGSFESQHYYYCCWRWGNDMDPSGCSLMSKFV